MNLPDVHEMLQRVGALTQHEAAHYVTAYAVGFDAQEITLHIRSDAHSGKARIDYPIRCESLTELQKFMHDRIIVILSGSMGEALDRSTLTVNGAAAYEILNEGATGAGQDFAVAKELIMLLHSSLPSTMNSRTGKTSTSQDLLAEFLGATLNLVNDNARPICALADELKKRVVAGGGIGKVEKAEIEQMSIHSQIQKVPSAVHIE